MNDKNPNVNHGDRKDDTYDLLHKSFSLFYDDDPVQEEEDVKNSGEIYFSANAENAFTQQSNGAGSSGGDYDWSRFETHGRERNPQPQRSGRTDDAYFSEHGAVHMSDEQPGRPAHAQKGDVRFSAPQTEEAPRRERPAAAEPKKEADIPYARRYARNDPPADAPKAEPLRANGKKEKKVKKGGRARAVIEAADDLIEGKVSKDSKRHTGWILALFILIIVATVSMIVRIPIMGCINDLLAINRDDTEYRVEIGQNMTTNDVIDLLAKKDLIYSGTFCKFIYDFLGHDPEEIYPAGTYSVSASMGLEGMMREIITAGATEDTVKISFPEGYTVDQIIEKLASNGVASSSALYGVIDSVEFIESYDFLTYIQDREQRYHYLEGYLYPDTYEFYIGENPQSVINRFLKNFSEKWNENFASRCERFDYTMDEVLTVASILEKEAKDAEQMPLVASILYNRLESSSFEYINCDSTAKYIDNQKEKLVAAGRYVSLIKGYDTYQQMGLPVGPICNPGADAIDAALNPDSTDYYYFIHDKEGKIYVASTLSEHQANLAEADVD